MTAITTHIHKKKGHKLSIVARTSSGKQSVVYPDFGQENNQALHYQAAKNLSARLGLGDNLVCGETKEGFAFIPASSGQVDLAAITEAARILIEAADAFPKGEKDPIRLAAGIIDLAKYNVGIKE